MAEAFGLAASILAVAELGISVTKSLYRLTVSVTGADAKIEEIEGRVSVTSSILIELHDIVQSNEQYFKRNPTGALEAPVSSCKRDYEKLKDAIDEVKGKPKIVESSTFEKWMARLKPREKLKWALGGEESMNELLNSLKTSKEDLGVLIDLLNYRLLIKAESRPGHVMTPEMIDDLAELKKQLPILVQLLKERGLMSGTVNNYGPKDEKETSNVETVTAPINNPSSVPVPEPRPEHTTDVARSPSQPRRSSSSSGTSITPLPPRVYEAWTFTGEVEKSYAMTKIQLSQTELSDFAMDNEHSPRRSSLSFLPPEPRKEVINLIDGLSHRNAYLSAVKPIKDRSSWWGRLRSRKKDPPDVVIVLRMEEKRHPLGGEPVEGVLEYAERRRDGRVVRMERKAFLEDTGERKKLEPVPYSQAVPYSLETPIPKGAESPIGDNNQEEDSALPSQEEAEHLVDEYLAGFTDLSYEGIEQRVQPS